MDQDLNKNDGWCLENMDFMVNLEESFKRSNKITE